MIVTCRPTFNQKWKNTESHTAVVSGVCWGRGGHVDTIFSCGWDKTILVRVCVHCMIEGLARVVFGARVVELMRVHGRASAAEAA